MEIQYKQICYFLIASIVVLYAPDVFAAANNDFLSQSNSANNPFQGVGEKGRDFVSGFLNWVAPVLALVAITGEIIMFMMGRGDFSRAIKTVGGATALGLVTTFATYLYFGAAG